MALWYNEVLFLKDNKWEKAYLIKSKQDGYYDVDTKGIDIFSENLELPYIRIQNKLPLESPEEDCFWVDNNSFPIYIGLGMGIMKKQRKDSSHPECVIFSQWNKKWRNVEISNIEIPDEIELIYNYHDCLRYPKYKFECIITVKLRNRNYWTSEEERKSYEKSDDYDIPSF